MAFSGKQPIGTMLVQAGKIDDDQLQKGLLAQSEKEGYIGETFVELGYIEPKELNNYISHQLKIPFLQLGYYNIDSSLMDLFSERLIRKQKMLPLFRLNNTLNLAISDPLDPEPINAARDATGLKIEPVIAMGNEIENAIDLHYGISGVVDSYGRVIKQLDIGERGYIDINLPSNLATTLYSRIGGRSMNLYIILVLLLTIVSLLFIKRLKLR